jgi:single-strand DNA-binding protein
MTDISGPARLAGNPELKTVGQGEDKQFVCEMRMRFLNGKPKKDSEEWVDNGFWADVNLWGKSAESAARLFEKGDRVHVVGNLIERHWPDKDDPEVEHSRLQVNASIVAPYLPDLETLRYKPRQSQQSRDDDVPADASDFAGDSSLAGKTASAF